MPRQRRSLIVLCTTVFVALSIAACGQSETKPDAGTGLDAGAGANGAVDAGSSTADAGRRDAGHESSDAGLSSDAGTDASDAGTRPDAGGPPCTSLDDIGPACETCVNDAEAACTKPGGPCASQHEAMVACAAAAGCTTSPIDWQCAGKSCFTEISQLDSCQYSSCPAYQACFP